MNKTVVIDFFSDSVQRYKNGYATVAVDVIRATTAAVTAVALGRRCFPVPTLEAALAQAERLSEPLLVGELGGNKPFGFHLNISPVEIAQNNETLRPMIMLSTSGTKLMYETRHCLAGFIACFRNYDATAEYLRDHYEHVAIIGAGSRREFREEDQMCCAWIADRLLAADFAPENRQTVGIIKRWREASPQACYVSKSVGYLKKTRQMKDLKFTLSYINDLHSAFMLAQDEILEIPVSETEPPRGTAAVTSSLFWEGFHP